MLFDNSQWQVATSIVQTLLLWGVSAAWILAVRSRRNYGLSQIGYLSIIDQIKTIKKTKNNKNKFAIVVFVTIMMLSAVSDLLLFKAGTLRTVADNTQSVILDSWQPVTTIGYYHDMDEARSKLNSDNVAQYCTESTKCFQTSATSRQYKRAIGSVINPEYNSTRTFKHMIDNDNYIYLSDTLFDVFASANYTGYLSYKNGSITTMTGSPNMYRDAESINFYVGGKAFAGLIAGSGIDELLSVQANKWANPQRRSDTGYTVCVNVACVAVYISSQVKSHSGAVGEPTAADAMNAWARANGVRENVMPLGPRFGTPEVAKDLFIGVTSYGIADDSSYMSFCVDTARPTGTTSTTCQIQMMTVHKLNIRAPDVCEAEKCVYMAGKKVSNDAANTGDRPAVQIYLDYIVNVIGDVTQEPLEVNQVVKALIYGDVRQDGPSTIEYVTLKQKYEVNVLIIYVVAVLCLVAIAAALYNAVLNDAQYKLPAIYTVVSSNAVEHDLQNIGNCRNTEVFDLAELRLYKQQGVDHIVMAYMDLEISLDPLCAVENDSDYDKCNRY